MLPALDTVLADAVDRAFIATVHGRFGGGVSATVMSGGRDQPHVLRAPAAGATGRLFIELQLAEAGLNLPSPSGFGAMSNGLSRVIGHVTMRPAPGGRMMDVKVVTEMFDDADGAARMSGVAHATGVLLHETDPGRIDVLRSPAAQQQRGLSQRQAQRGWLPQPGRTRLNRGGGLGSNGRVTAPLSQLALPVAATLLRRVAERLAEAVGDSFERVVIGLERDDAA